MIRTAGLLILLIIILPEFSLFGQSGISARTEESCQSWLYLPSQPSYVDIGDLDIPGNQVTVEAMITRTTPWSGGDLFAGDIVSKHDGPGDANYLLRPNSAEITTTNGYFRTPDVCGILLNKTYHVAMVYDGSTLKFYRNGFLLSQVAATGNLVLNNWHTRIGLYFNQAFQENFIGYINEVRIWNVARSQTALRANMNGSLPSPATQPGLLAYYTFDNLLNKQGNGAWNGLLGGSAAINHTNPHCTFTADSCNIVVPSFTAPDTVCVNAPVNIVNTSQGASSYYWNFCVGNLHQPPQGVNFGNINNAMDGPVYVDYVEENGNWYAFVPDNHVKRLYRLDFGNSLLNTPTLVNLGNAGGVIPPAAEGIQVVKNEGRWYAIIVGGQLSNSRIVKLDFGPNITNTSPAGTNWGNIGNMDYPHDLYLFQEYGRWFGFTTNTDNNTFTRFDFSASFNNTPSGTNLGTLGNMVGPTGIQAISNNGNWHVFVTNANNSTITRLDFGNSLLNSPSAVNLGNIGGLFHACWDIHIMKFCGEILAYVINADQRYNDVLKLDFHNDLISVPSATTFGNIGNLSFPHAISKIFRAGSDLYSFIPNVDNSSISRLRFPGCINSSIPNSTAQMPPPVTYNAPGTYNLTLTVDEGMPTQDAFCKQVVVMPPPVPVTDTLYVCSNDSIRIGSSVPSATWQWNTGATTDSIHGKPDNLYWVQNERFGCTATDSFRILSTRHLMDFGFEQDECLPLNFRFTSTGTLETDPWWSMGDGQTVSGPLTITHNYSSFGDYAVQFSVRDGSCRDTITKMISVNVTHDNLIAVQDTVVCYGATKQLQALPALSYCWWPSTYLDNPNVANPVSSTPENITYFLTSQVTGNNLIVNGDFSAGNTGFTSAYNFAGTNISEGQYFVGTNPQAWNPSLSPCTDHTSGTGAMMLVNGSPAPDVKVWTQTISVTPHTNYAFAAWIQALFAPNPAQLQFSINGNTIGNLITPDLPTCTWTQFYTTWNSGDNSTAVISIVNKNTQVQGNDFALDDISFAPVRMKQDSVVITVEKPVVATNNDTVVCNGLTVQLNSTGADTWSWQPATGLSDANIANPVATPSGSTEYIVTGTTVNGCVEDDTVTIGTFPFPAITKTSDTVICANTPAPLFASGGVTYSWTPAATLNDASLPNPVATPDTNTTYNVLITDEYACTYTDSVKVDIYPRPAFTASGNTAICEGSSVTLHATGGDQYSWSPVASLDDPLSPDPVALPAASTTYNVHISENVCNYDTSFDLTVTVNPNPVVQAQKSNDINCRLLTVQLIATGADSYAWSPATGVDYADQHNPVAAIDTTTTFTVIGANQFGCTGEASVEIKVTKEDIPIYALPNAFTPNGDGRNDCFGIRKWGHVTLLEFSIYNRWGHRIFSTNNPSRCWDGTFNGKYQDTGGYAFVIRARTFCGEVKRTGIVMLIR